MGPRQGVAAGQRGACYRRRMSSKALIALLAMRNLMNMMSTKEYILVTTGMKLKKLKRHL